MEMNIKFDFDDILITPAVRSSIRSRKSVGIVDENGMLPLFTAPMDTVTDVEHRDIFSSKGIYPVIPRTRTKDFTAADCARAGGWVALSLDQFEKITSRVHALLRYVSTLPTAT
jgi:hypothetical protein